MTFNIPPHMVSQEKNQMCCMNRSQTRCLNLLGTRSARKVEGRSMVVCMIYMRHRSNKTQVRGSKGTAVLEAAGRPISSSRKNRSLSQRPAPLTMREQIAHRPARTQRSEINIGRIQTCAVEQRGRPQRRRAYEGQQHTGPYEENPWVHVEAYTRRI